MTTELYNLFVHNSIVIASNGLPHSSFATLHDTSCNYWLPAAYGAKILLVINSRLRHKYEMTFIQSRNNRTILTVATLARAIRQALATTS